MGPQKRRTILKEQYLIQHCSTYKRHLVHQKETYFSQALGCCGEAVSQKKKKKKRKKKKEKKKGIGKILLSKRKHKKKKKKKKISLVRQ